MDERLLEARDAIGMQLPIVDRPAFLSHTIGAKAGVRVHHRLITLAVTYVLPRRPRARPVARIGLRAIGYYLGAARAHLRASAWHDSDRRQECGRECQGLHELLLCCH
jgi:hypothetical protein